MQFAVITHILALEPWTTCQGFGVSRGCLPSIASMAASGRACMVAANRATKRLLSTCSYPNHSA